MSLILIVEDDDLLRRTYERILKHDYDFISVDSVELAIEVLKIQRADLVLSDCDMGRLSGVDLWQWCRSHRPSLPFMMLSGRGARPVKYKGVYFTKPIMPKALRTAINSLLIEQNQKG